MYSNNGRHPVTKTFTSGLFSSIATCLGKGR